MKIKEGFTLKNVCGENVVIATGRQNIDFTKLITLNESAAVIWNAVVGKEFSVDDMVAALTAEYDVDEQTARSDAEEVVRQWKENEIL